MGSCGVFGLGLAFSAKSLACPGPGVPSSGCEVAFRPLHPRAAWHSWSVLTLEPSSPNPGLALIKLSGAASHWPPRLSKPQ